MRSPQPPTGSMPEKPPQPKHVNNFLPRLPPLTASQEKFVVEKVRNLLEIQKQFLPPK